MKRYLIIFILSVIMIAPWDVFAANPSVSNISVTSVDEASIGESVKVNMKVTLSGVGSGGEEDYVVVGILYGVAYDDSLVTAINMVQEDWPVAFVEDEESGGGVLMNVYTKQFAASCRDGKYCTTASMPVNFFINKSTASSASIQVLQVGLIYVKSSDLDRYLQAMENDDATGVDDYVMSYIQNVNSTKTIRIKQTENQNVQTPPSQMEENKVQTPVSPEIKGGIKTEAPPASSGNNQNNNTNSSTTVTKSNNKYLSSLQVENYPFSFDKNIHEYDITIEPGVNALNVTATVEDSKATYQIFGAEDLENNNHQVIIEVTAEDGEKGTYTITTKEKEAETTNLSSQKKKKEKKSFSIKLKKEHFMIGGAGLFLLLILFLILKLKDRKIDKALKDL